MDANVYAYGCVANMFHILGANKEANDIKNKRGSFVVKDPVSAIKQGINENGTRFVKYPSQSCSLISIKEIPNYWCLWKCEDI